MRRTKEQREQSFWMKQFFAAYHDAEYWKGWAAAMALLFVCSVLVNMYLIHMYC